MQSRIHLKCLALLILSFPAFVFAFDFSYTAPTSCDNLTISWSGGNGPFFLLISPVFNVPQNISIPDSAVDATSGNGSFSIQLTLPPERQFLLTMSDSTGFGSGGISDVLTVGSSLTGADCNTTEPSPDFIFQLSTALQQCRQSTFSGYDNAKQPVRIFGLIPLGQSFELDPPSGPTSFDWTVDVAQGTSILFIMSDAEGGQGGSSKLLTVTETDDNSCISASSPHSTTPSTSGASTTQTGDNQATQTGDSQATQTAQGHATNQTGAIAGAVVGGAALISLVSLISFFCFRRRNNSKYGNESLHRQSVTFVGTQPSLVSRIRSSLLPSGGRMERAHPSFDLLPPVALQNTSHRDSPLAHSTVPRSNEEEYLPNPYVLPSEASTADGHSAYRSSDADLREPPPSMYHSRDGSLSYARSHARWHSGSNTEAPLSPRSALSSPPYSLGHARLPSVPHSNRSASARSPTKSSLSGATTTPRLILHTDAEDVDGSDGGEEVIELPPQYTDRRDPDTKSTEAKGSDLTSS